MKSGKTGKVWLQSLGYYRFLIILILLLATKALIKSFFYRSSHSSSTHTYTKKEHSKTNPDETDCNTHNANDGIQGHKKL